MKNPVIGVTLDIEKAAKGAYSAEIDWYALRQNYVTAISKYGADVILLPHEVGSVDSYLKIIDGLVVTGGHFDIPPEIYGVDNVHEKVTTKDNRTKFEFDITRKAIDKKIPFLGICGGEQLLNVVCGGSLIQHIPDEIENALEHEQKTTHDKPAHKIEIVKGSLLHKITGVTELQVNSSHHQAVKDPGKRISVSATAPDGVIEAIELTSQPFCLGVEWHPEYEISEQESRIFASLVEACT